jgi:hypothetical protein
VASRLVMAGGALAIAGAAFLFAFACGGSRPMVSALELPDAGRSPDGVLIEPPAALPPAVIRAEARGVVALREPVGDEAIREVVRALVAGFEHEDLEALKALLTPDAVLIGARGSHLSVADSWMRRLRTLDYTSMSGVEVVRLERIQRFDFDDLGTGDAPTRPPEMKPGDVLIRVPIETPMISGEKLFGDAWIVLLRRDAGRFRVAGYSEDDDK